MKTTFFSLLTLLVSFTSLSAATLRVPGDFDTLKEAVAGAQSGDTLLLGPGTFAGSEHIDADGIIIRKSLILRGSSIGNTVIDCEGSADNPRRAFTISNGPSSTDIVNVRLEHLTIINGEHSNGGAVLARDNLRHRALPGTTEKFTGRVNLTVDNCLFENNTATEFSHGGAIYALFANAVIRNCDFLANTGDIGGALALVKGTFNISRCNFEGNRKSPTTRHRYSAASALYMGDLISGITVTNCRMTGNISDFGVIHYSGIGTQNDYNILLENCLVAGNTGRWAGSLSFVGPHVGQVNCLVNNCTIADNITVEDERPGIRIVRQNIAFHNCIIHNDGPLQDFNDIDERITHFSDCCLDFSWTGAGTNNLRTDPQFREGDLYLLSGASPCVNSANPATATTTDALGASRSQPDRGCFERLRRGDANEDGLDLTVSDAQALLDIQFSSRPRPYDPEVADVNSDGVLNLTDVFKMFQHLFAGTFTPAPLP